jgi:hypothetical protein
MIHYNRPHSIYASLMALAFCTIVPRIAPAQTATTKNAFVSAQVGVHNGLITLWKGAPPTAGDSGLTFPGQSFLTVEVNNVFYTNNPNIGTASDPPAINLSSPEISKDADTVRMTWFEKGFDIVQNVYPVAFANSGVIVISIEIVNHTAAVLPAQAQYLMDNDNSTASAANDAPSFLVDSQLVSNWTEDSSGQIPSFVITVQNPPDSVSSGTVGIGYFNDLFTPSPIGLLSPSLVQFGSWPVLQANTWGPATPTSGFNDDNGTLMMGQPASATSFVKGVSDSMTEIFRTAFGTPPERINAAAVSPSNVVQGSNQFFVFPNPLTTTAALSYSLGTRSTITISVFDVLGREVARPVSDIEQDAGNNSVTLDARNLSPGVYTCILSASGSEQMVKVVVTR